MHFFSTLVVASAFVASSVLAHPGHDTRHEIEERAAFMKNSKRDLSHCAAKMKARGLEARAIQRRAAIAKSTREKRGLSTNAPYLRAREAASVLNTTHHSDVDYTPLTAETTIFSSNNSCILSPEVTQGPYYASGEYIRRNLIEDQEGVEMIIDIQVIDMATCEPVVNSMIDFWHCNSTGVYSGVVASGNGDSTDTSNLDATFLRGLQPTQYDGVAQFTTLFPGHYTGRAPHIHVLAHFNGSILSNSTYNGGSASHVGQIFFDQDLISQVETVAPYSGNTQELTTNAEDSIFAEEAASSDPVVEYSFIGDSIEDGIFAWVSFGVDLTNSFTISPASTLTEDGGVANENSGMGGGGGGPGGNSTDGGPPSGAVPSGVAPSGAARR
ncbi:hypothetical protein V496_04075 [Pseudogymnoascus sp. VKM F-4515 (FW-2607)]|nr:hypothetical protein V496_04075 [Pseudogymnoascus sp. VKM F-4515 (FW-2607)]KFY98906.1 hypothetical protein V498_01133 [Pseudogymnoascus sp. VKM F-4517 (FW-2822)]